MSGFTAAEQVVLTEAYRVVPGIIAAQERDDCVGAATLLRDYHVTAVENYVPMHRAWQILWIASMHWNKMMASTLAADTDNTIEGVAQQIAVSAALFAGQQSG